MGNERSGVAGREYYRWEIEFPSVKAARRIAKRLVEKEIDHLLEEDLIFVRDRDVIVPILEKEGFRHVWLLLEEQG